ncbi:hypothetical protein KR009_002823, partial [Drosophila setifemur]
ISSLSPQILQLAGAAVLLLVMTALQMGAEHLSSDDCGCGRRG